MTLAKELLRQSEVDGWMADTWGVLLARSNRSKRQRTQPLAKNDVAKSSVDRIRSTPLSLGVRTSSAPRRVATGLTREDPGR